MKIRVRTEKRLKPKGLETLPVGTHEAAEACASS